MFYLQMKVDMDRDAHLSVKELVEQERMTTAEDQLAMFGAMSAKVKELTKYYHFLIWFISGSDLAKIGR